MSRVGPPPGYIGESSKQEALYQMQQQNKSHVIRKLINWMPALVGRVPGTRLGTASLGTACSKSTKQ